MSIGENLRQLRLQKGLTQEQAAAKLHITRQALSSYESQRTQPDIHMLLALAEVYETDLDGILYGQETSLKNLRRLRTLALWLLALLTGLGILSAAFLWSANAFFPLTGGQLEQMETAVAIHFRLTDAWETLDGFILLLSNLGFLGLLLLKQMGKCNLSLGRRVAYMGSDAVKLQFVIGHDLTKLRDVKGSQSRTAGNQNAFCRLARDEKSRTFSSNSKRSYILRTSSRSRRLILSSIVSFAVWLKCTRTI